MKKSKVIAYITMMFYITGLTPTGLFGHEISDKNEIVEMRLPKESLLIKKDKGITN